MSEPVLAGALRDHPRAREFAEVVKEVHHRYATEVVGHFSLCPHMKDPESAFGVFCVVLDREPDLETALAQVEAASGQVAHLIYPLCTLDTTRFERFGSRLHDAVGERCDPAPVHATFHPTMHGDTSSASRLVGFVRRAPDPFIQFVPEGLHKGGSVFIDIANIDLTDLDALPKDNSKSLFKRLDSADHARIEASVIDIRRERDTRYAPFLEALDQA